MVHEPSVIFWFLLTNIHHEIVNIWWSKTNDQSEKNHVENEGFLRIIGRVFMIFPGNFSENIRRNIWKKCVEAIDSISIFLSFSHCISSCNLDPHYQRVELQQVMKKNRIFPTLFRYVYPSDLFDRKTERINDRHDPRTVGWISLVKLKNLVASFQNPTLRHNQLNLKWFVVRCNNETHFYNVSCFLTSCNVFRSQIQRRWAYDHFSIQSQIQRIIVVPVEQLLFTLTIGKPVIPNG